MTKRANINLKQIVLVILGIVFLAQAPAQQLFSWDVPWYWHFIAMFLGFFLLMKALSSSDQAEREQALAHMAGRPTLSDSDFGKNYFPPDRAEIAATLREILTRLLKLDLSRLHPQDRFVEDLRIAALDSLGLVEFAIEIEQKFGIKIPDVDLEKLLTFQSVVDYVADAVKAKSRPS